MVKPSVNRAVMKVSEETMTFPTLKVNGLGCLLVIRGNDSANNEQLQVK